MSFTSADWLWLLLAVAAVAAAYVLVNLRRRAYTVRFTNLALLESVTPRRPQWFRRHVPAILLLAALVALVVAMAGPAREDQVPKERATIILAIDVSNSMAATDVSPTRLAAAQDGATAFVNRLPAPINLGLVSFAGSASLLVAPTTDRDAVRTAVHNLRLGPGTAIGEAGSTSLNAIQAAARFQGPQGPPPAAIVLLSDGETTVGMPNSQAAQLAVAAKVPVDTIAYGTPDGTVEIQGEIVPVPVNVDALVTLADQTGGKSFRAETGDELKQVYESLGSSIGYRTERHDITRQFVAAGLALALLAGALAVWWSARLP
ncbi:MAG: VWA domain-containing protein [Frankiaceae bacterium]